MVYSVKENEEFKYVSLIILAGITAEQYEQSIIEAKRALDLHGWQKLFIDITDVQNMMSIPRLYEHAKKNQDFLPLVMKTAVLVTPGQVDAIEFYENVAQNRGINYRGFLDRQQALDWLLE